MEDLLTSPVREVERCSDCVLFCFDRILNLFSLCWAIHLIMLSICSVFPQEILDFSFGVAGSMMPCNDGNRTRISMSGGTAE